MGGWWLVIALTAQLPLEGPAEEEPAPAASQDVFPGVSSAPSSQSAPAPEATPPRTSLPRALAVAAAWAGGRTALTSVCATLGGCTLGAIPAALMVSGLSLVTLAVIRGQSMGGCGGALLILLGVYYGALVCVPGLLSLGPCSSTGAALGGLLGALPARWPWLTGCLGVLPGAALGCVAGWGGVATMLGGLLLSSNTGEPFILDQRARRQFLPGWFLAAAGLLMVLTAGPVGVLASTATGGAWITAAELLSGAALSVRQDATEAPAR
jgi:hypothetical protein